MITELSVKTCDFGFAKLQFQFYQCYMRWLFFCSLIKKGMLSSFYVFLSFSVLCILFPFLLWINLNSFFCIFKAVWFYFLWIVSFAHFSIVFLVFFLSFNSSFIYTKRVVLCDINNFLLVFHSAFDFVYCVFCIAF